MANLVEDFALRLGWHLAKGNVVVEGTSDVAIIEHAAALYRTAHSVDLLGSELAILPAGLGDDGGVDGINKRFQAMRQVAQADLDRDGKLRYRFIALYDNDDAGRRAISSAASFDRSLKRYGELFLLRPVMPIKGGVDSATLERRCKEHNAPFLGLDWEVEDLLSEEFLDVFSDEFPTAIIRTRTVGGMTHRGFTRDGKRALVGFVREYASLRDVIAVVRLIRALRDYVNLRADHIICEN